jgi:hypothetical protein
MANASFSVEQMGPFTKKWLLLEKSQMTISEVSNE